MTNKKIRLKIRLELYLSGKLVHSTTRHKKSSIRRVIQVFQWDKAYLKVTYPLGSDYFNDGWYISPPKLVRAIQLFTEGHLIQELS